MSKKYSNMTNDELLAKKKSYDDDLTAYYSTLDLLPKDTFLSRKSIEAYIASTEKKLRKVKIELSTRNILKLQEA